jgi:hypothetical protein
MGPVPEMVNHRGDRYRYSIALGLEEGLTEAQLGSEGQSREAGEQRGEAKDRDEAGKPECQPRAQMSIW